VNVGLSLSILANIIKDETLEGNNMRAYTSFTMGGDVQSLLEVSKAKSISQPGHLIDQVIRKVDFLVRRQFRLPIQYVEFTFFHIGIVEFTVESAQCSKTRSDILHTISYQIGLVLS
jgi:hypothetical protein